MNASLTRGRGAPQFGNGSLQCACVAPVSDWVRWAVHQIHSKVEICCALEGICQGRNQSETGATSGTSESWSPCECCFHFWRERCGSQPSVGAHGVEKFPVRKCAGNCSRAG